MRSKKAWRVICAVLFVAVICRAAPAAAGNCALYARAETGVALYGAAGGWWDQAEGRYRRGRTPAVGAILVFERTRHMPSGHVAVVSAILGPREIQVDQSNWFRGSTTRGDTVVDTSVNNDWTSVAVAGGIRDNPTFGFIYAQAAADGLDTYVGDGHDAAAGLVRLAVARDEPVETWPHRHYSYRHHGAHGHAKRAAAHHRTARHEPARHPQHRHA